MFVSYGLSGIGGALTACGMEVSASAIPEGLGVFECTFLNTITPLGKLTKAGLPAGSSAERLTCLRGMGHHGHPLGLRSGQGHRMQLGIPEVGRKRLA